MSINIVVPQLGESVVEARVARWLKKAGDAVAAGDALVELETEKIDLEVSAEHGRRPRADRLRQEGEDVKVGEVLAVIDASADGESPPPDLRQRPAADSPAAGTRSDPSRTRRDRATPTARKVAEQHNVEPRGRSAPSGEAGRVVKHDVESFLAQAQRRRRASRRSCAARVASRDRARAPAAARWRARRGTRADVEAPADHRAQPGRGAAARRRC